MWSPYVFDQSEQVSQMRRILQEPFGALGKVA
jgi:hypothetical protein